jgi:hypothetical protein
VGACDVDHDLLATTSRARSIASTRIAISGRPGSSRVKFGVGLVTTASGPKAGSVLIWAARAPRRAPACFLWDSMCHRCTSSHGAHARCEAILTTPPVLFDRALLFEASEDRADGASRSGALCGLIHILDQGSECHRLFGQSGDYCIACGDVDWRAARKRVDAAPRADDCTFRKQTRCGELDHSIIGNRGAAHRSLQAAQPAIRRIVACSPAP